MPAPTSRTTPRKAPAAKKASAARKAVPISSPALEAVRAEITGDPAVPKTWTFGGETFDLQVDDEPDMRVFVLFDRGDLARWIAMVLGTEGYERLMALDTDEPLTPRKTRELLDAWGAAVFDGLDTGE